MVFGALEMLFVVIARFYLGGVRHDSSIFIKWLYFGEFAGRRLAFPTYVDSVYTPRVKPIIVTAAIIELKLLASFNIGHVIYYRQVV
jgi:hypothetical protein